VHVQLVWGCMLPLEYEDLTLGRRFLPTAIRRCGASGRDDGLISM